MASPSGIFFVHSSASTPPARGRRHLRLAGAIRPCARRIPIQALYGRVSPWYFFDFADIPKVNSAVGGDISADVRVVRSLPFYRPNRSDIRVIDDAIGSYITKENAESHRSRVQCMSLIVGHSG